MHIYIHTDVCLNLHKRKCHYHCIMCKLKYAHSGNAANADAPSPKLNDANLCYPDARLAQMDKWRIQPLLLVQAGLIELSL